MHTHRQGEVDAKLARLRARMADRRLAAVVVEQNTNIAWLTAGASTAINLASDTGTSPLVITANQAFVVTDRIEARRLADEEDLPGLGFTPVVEPWEHRGGELARLTTGRAVGADTPRFGGDWADMSADLSELRVMLMPAEAERLRYVGRMTSDALAEVIGVVTPGMTEFEIAGRLDDACRRRGGWASVNLVASDERIAAYRHPLPTGKRVERYAMLVLCCRWQGLIAAATRLIHFGPLPEELMAAAHMVARVDATLINATRAGRTLGEQWALARETYTAAGYPEAVYEHHQGGSIAYLPRERLATPDDPTPIQLYQAFAWNPSVRGMKSEDTVLLTEDGPQVITETPGWPTWEVTLDGATVARPAILVR
ncbi:MAG TPA: M24 family metallopeptidase [Ktedonobacterales bacterium]|nr:M24 family metallopeptidase [Ktedonobacterales bacterium]